MAQNSAEYLTLVGLNASIQLALKDHLTDIGGQLLASGLIAPTQNEAIINSNNPANERAAKLVGHILTKVQQNPPQHYGTFIGVLEKDLTQYGDILKKLKEKYDSLHTGGAGQQPQAAAAGGGQIGGMLQ